MYFFIVFCVVFFALSTFKFSNQIKKIFMKCLYFFIQLIEEIILSKLEERSTVAWNLLTFLCHGVNRQNMLVFEFVLECV